MRRRSPGTEGAASRTGTVSDALAEHRRHFAAEQGAKRRPMTYWCLHKGGAVVPCCLSVLLDVRGVWGV